MIHPVGQARRLRGPPGAKQRERVGFAPGLIGALPCGKERAFRVAGCNAERYVVSPKTEPGTESPGLLLVFVLAVVNEGEGDGVVATIVFIVTGDIGSSHLQRDRFVKLVGHGAVGGGVFIAVPIGDDGVNIPCVDAVGFQLPEREGRSKTVSGDDAAQRTLVKIIAPGLQKTLKTGFRSRVGGGHQNDPAGIRAPHQALWPTQYLNAGETAAQKVLYSRTDLRGRGVCDIDTVEYDACAVPLLTANAHRSRFAIAAIHRHGDAGLSIQQRAEVRVSQCLHGVTV